MKRTKLILLLLALILIIGCAKIGDKTVIPGKEEIKSLKEIKEYSEKTIIAPVELDLSDPLIAKCKEQLDKCKQSLIDSKSDFTFEILEMEKFEPAQGDYGLQESYLKAEEFYSAHRRSSQTSILSDLQNNNLRYNTQLTMFNVFPVVLTAGKTFVRPEVLEKMGIKGQPNELPIVLICYKDGTLLGESKAGLGC